MIIKNILLQNDSGGPNSTITTTTKLSFTFTCMIVFFSKKKKNNLNCLMAIIFYIMCVCLLVCLNPLHPLLFSSIKYTTVCHCVCCCNDSDSDSD